jgi:hypothetical protein
MSQVQPAQMQYIQKLQQMKPMLELQGKKIMDSVKGRAQTALQNSEQFTQMKPMLELQGKKIMDSVTGRAQAAIQNSEQFTQMKPMLELQGKKIMDSVTGRAQAAIQNSEQYNKFKSKGLDALNINQLTLDSEKARRESAATRLAAESARNDLGFLDKTIRKAGELAVKSLSTPNLNRLAGLRAREEEEMRSVGVRGGGRKNRTKKKSNKKRTKNCKNKKRTKKRNTKNNKKTKRNKTR